LLHGLPNGRPKHDVVSEIAKAIFENNPELIYRAYVNELRAKQREVTVGRSESAQRKRKRESHVPLLRFAAPFFFVSLHRFLVATDGSSCRSDTLDARPTRAAPCVSTLHGGRVHLDPVGPDLRPQAFALPIEDNQICLEPGHMTINAIVR
jgi:hypothetical protein